MAFQLAIRPPTSLTPTFSTNHRPSSSNLSASNICRPRRRLCRSRRTLNVLAFFGLTTPPYELAMDSTVETGLLVEERGVMSTKGRGFMGLIQVLCVWRDYEKWVHLHELAGPWKEEMRPTQRNVGLTHLENSPLYGYTMEELVKVTYNNGNPFPEFNDAAEVWNHDFFWESMQPGGRKMPWGGVLQQIEKDFGSFTNFKEEFIREALSLFGSGWVWLVLKTKEKKLAVVKTPNALNPLIWGDIHAYYPDYKDDKGRYVSTYMNNLVSWHTATVRMARAESFVNLGEPRIPEL
ncbi:hypothetical protein ACLOJK_032807 [Asimina triloba]